VGGGGSVWGGEGGLGCGLVVRGGGVVLCCFFGFSEWGWGVGGGVVFGGCCVGVRWS